MKAARRVTGNENAYDSDSSIEGKLAEIKSGKQEPIKPSLKKSDKGQKKGSVAVAFNVESDLKAFNTDKAKLIKETVNSSKTDEEQVLKSLFVTQDDDALDDFEKEKEQDIEGQLGKKVKAEVVKQGWNEWAGQGVDMSRHEQRKTRAEENRTKKIEALKQKRQDTKLKGVQINETEERDKKFA